MRMDVPMGLFQDMFQNYSLNCYTNISVILTSWAVVESQL